MRWSVPHGGANVLAVNTLSSARTEVVTLPEQVKGQQQAADGSSLGVVRVPAVGYTIGAATPVQAQVTLTENADTIVLENEYVRATFKPNGNLVSLYDLKKKREAVQKDAPANKFVMFDDNPIIYDAWDVDIFHLEKPVATKDARRAQVTERGPLRASIQFDYELTPKCSITQTVSLTALSPRLDFTNEIDWSESHKILKAEFPVNVRAQNATFEIQFGHLQRPTHFNTSWDVARFEVPAHKWVDLSEPDYGVALLNDCKYGHSVYENVMRLSLLRAPKHPDPNADQGHHTIRYALLPHDGSLQQAGVVAEVYRFNEPLLVRATDHAPENVSFFNVDAPAIVIETIKKAEDSNALVIRLYEAHGTRGTFRLSSSLPIKSAALCNLLEETQTPLVWAYGGVDLEFAPFKIITLKLSL